MRPLRAIAAAFALFVSAVCVTVVAQPRRPSYVVIVNRANPVTSVDRAFLEDVFLKKATRWPNDEVVQPADLAADSPVRRDFTEDVLKRSVQAVKVYWQQRIFSGRDVPPPEFDRDEESVKYVLRHTGAVAYVSAGADRSASKTVLVQ